MLIIVKHLEPEKPCLYKPHGEVQPIRVTALAYSMSSKCW